MFLSKKKHKKTQLQVFIEYAIHIWFIIFISNVVIFLGFRFFTLASEIPPKGDETEFVEEDIFKNKDFIGDMDISPIPEETIVPSIESDKPVASPTPEGPIIKLSFSIPGIGTNGGNLKPLRAERDVSIYFYDAGANIADKKVRPLHVIKTKAVFDNNPQSPHYLQFVNNYVDLGAEVIGLKSQVGIKTGQTLIQVIKGEDPKDKGGEIISLKKEGKLFILPTQEMIIGDIYPIPEADNFMDINDYNMLINCFGEKASTSKCISGSTADLDDNGVIDGIDYNLMLLSFQTLKEQGFPVPVQNEKPKIVINPIISTPLEKINNFIKTKPTKTPVPTKVPVKKASSGGGFNSVIFIFIFIIILIIAGFVIFKFRLLDKIRKRLPGATQASKETVSQTAQVTDNQTSPEVPADQPVQEQTDTAQLPSDPTKTDQTNPDQPVRIDPASNTKSPADVFGSTPTPASESSTTQQPAQDDGVIEKSGFVKKVQVDQEKNGTWITLADDSGITRGFIKNTNITDGFAKVKGTMKTDAESKSYLDITSLTPEE